MKTQVDLYTSEFQPTLRLLSLPIVLVIWTLLLIVFTSLYGYLSVSEQNLQQQLEQLDKNNSNQQTLLNSLIAEISNVSADQKLLDQVNNKQLQVNLKKRVYAELTGKEQTKSAGFAQLMVDLAEYHHRDVWLKRIYLNEQNVSIEGGASQSVSIPVWVNKLSQSDFFKGQEFSTTRIYRDDEQQLNFVLATDEKLISSSVIYRE